MGWTELTQWGWTASFYLLLIWAFWVTIMKMRACVCTQPVRTAVGEEETTESRSNVIFPSLSLSLSLPSLPPPRLSFSCSSFTATAIRIAPLSPSRAIILFGYAMHSTPTETSWCWRLMYQWWCLQIHNAVATGCCSSYPCLSLDVCSMGFYSFCSCSGISPTRLD